MTKRQQMRDLWKLADIDYLYNETPTPHELAVCIADAVIELNPEGIREWAIRLLTLLENRLIAIGYTKESARDTLRYVGKYHWRPFQHEVLSRYAEEYYGCVLDSRHNTPVCHIDDN